MATRQTPEEFLERAQKLWGNRWDYSSTLYLRARDKVSISCRAHGEFWQSPVGHLEGKVGCAQCNGKSVTTSSFIEDAHSRFGSKFDYSSLIYVNSTTKITITCREHGDFQQLPWLHLYGKVGCGGCKAVRGTSADFKDKATQVWGGSATYDKAVYLGHDKPISISCPDHGEFSQLAEYHLRGSQGCLKCRTYNFSLGEKEMASLIQSLGVHIEEGRRDLLGTAHEIDIYVPKRYIAFEFNGVYYHSEKFKDPAYHYNKWKMAADKGIVLYQVWEDDWNLRRDILERHIKQVLGKSDLARVHARKLKVKEVTTAEAKPFLDLNHIQGFASGTVYVGGFYKEELVALAVFRKAGEDYTLVRYATSAHVIGGHSKLVAHFERSYKYEKLVTFADRTFGSGDLYRKTGWMEDKLLPPDYSYLVRGERKHKFGYRLKRFRDDPALKFEEGKTERELAQMNGLLRVYDAGKIRFIKGRPQL